LPQRQWSAKGVEVEIEILPTPDSGADSCAHSDTDAARLLRFLAGLLGYHPVLLGHRAGLLTRLLIDFAALFTRLLGGFARLFARLLRQLADLILIHLEIHLESAAHLEWAVRLPQQ